MGDKMTPIPFGSLMTRILQEKKREGAVFGVTTLYAADPARAFPIFGRFIETPFGPAAGPNTQLAQNIVAAYCAGARFFELKTVQILDGDDLPVSKPCILARDEGYNVEWSTELYVPEAFDEYVKAWFALKVMAVEFGLGSPEGFCFNMSVGYDLAGIKSEKIDRFIEGLKNAEDTAVFKDCSAWLLEHISDFERLTADDVLAVSPNICNSITLSTLHGCPPREIESITEYLLREKGLNTFIKCNPTLLGYDFARRTMDAMGYGYLSFGRFHFEDDLQYTDAAPLLERMGALADSLGLGFGVKLTNTFPVDIRRGELPGEEMYMSGRALYPLSMALAARLSADFKGKLRISYSGGADISNIEGIFSAGIWPITMATTVLKPGGYQRFYQIANALRGAPAADFQGVEAAAASALAEKARTDPHNIKAAKPLPDRKISGKPPLTGCFIAPCVTGCPFGQDVPAYLALAGEGKYDEALALITAKNPLPFITGAICSHPCMERCTRNFYDCPVDIRGVKLLSAQNAGQARLDALRPASPSGKSCAVVGGGPAGMAAAYFLAKNGAAVTLFEKTGALGGTVRHVIPDFRIGGELIDMDAQALYRLGVEVLLGHEIKNLRALAEKYDYVIAAVGAGVRGGLELPGGRAINAIDFLESFKAAGGELDAGENVAVIGGGNTAMDTARAALRTKNVKKVRLIYRRDTAQMPADSHELELALAEGVEFVPLASPVSMENGVLRCRKNALGQPDASGRAAVEALEEYFDIPADTVIAAVGEKADAAFYAASGVSPEHLTTDGVIFLAGDGFTGPATVAKAIRGAMDAAQAILDRPVAEDAPAHAPTRELFAKKGLLCESCERESDRCLDCGALCGNCVDVCPNRANVLINIPGRAAPQVLHLDKMCNECGNCSVFCPYSGDPYRDKFTLFDTPEDMENSENSGFAVTDLQKGDYIARVDGETLPRRRLPEELVEFIETVISDYPYLF